MSSDQSLAARPGIHRDVVTWMVLGLVIAAILVFLTQRGVGARPTHRSLSPTSASTPPTGRTSPNATTTTTTVDVTNPTTSTTTTSAPLAGQAVQSGSSTTTTTANVDSGAQIVTLTLAGRLVYPSDIISTFPLATIGGTVSATLTWRGGASLALSLRCNKESLHRASAMGLIQLVLITPATDCVVQVSGDTETMTPAPYSLLLSYPGATDANGN